MVHHHFTEAAASLTMMGRCWKELEAVYTSQDTREQTQDREETKGNSLWLDPDWQEEWRVQAYNLAKTTG